MSTVARGPGEVTPRAPRAQFSARVMLAKEYAVLDLLDLRLHSFRQTSGVRGAQGCACSSWLAMRIRMSSRP